MWFVCLKLQWLEHRSALHIICTVYGGDSRSRFILCRARVRSSSIIFPLRDSDALVWIFSACSVLAATCQHAELATCRFGSWNTIFTALYVPSWWVCFICSNVLSPISVHGFRAHIAAGHRASRVGHFVGLVLRLCWPTCSTVLIGAAVTDGFWLHSHLVECRLCGFEQRERPTIPAIEQPTRVHALYGYGANWNAPDAVFAAFNLITIHYVCLAVQAVCACIYAHCQPGSLCLLHFVTLSLQSSWVFFLYIFVEIINVFINACKHSLFIPFKLIILKMYSRTNVCIQNEHLHSMAKQQTLPPRPGKKRALCTIN